MEIIINELSLSNFKDSWDFVCSLQKYTLPFLKLVKNLNEKQLYSIQFLKKTTIYDCQVTTIETLHQLLNQRNSPKGLEKDTFSRLKLALNKYVLSEPYWDLNPKHFPTDTYKTNLTQETANYSIAEACERDKIVFSFCNALFGEKKSIEVEKNGKEQFIIYNITSNVRFLDYLLEQKQKPLDWEQCLKRNPIQNLFPNTLYLFKERKDSRVHLETSERVALDRHNAQIVAILNYWQYDSSISAKNSGRIIYSAGEGNQKLCISLDTENGRFELFNNRGVHLGEYDFYGNKTKESKSNRKIKL